MREEKEKRLINAVNFELLNLNSEDSLALINTLRKHLSKLEQIVGRGSVGEKEEAS